MQTRQNRGGEGFPRAIALSPSLMHFFAPNAWAKLVETKDVHIVQRSTPQTKALDNSLLVSWATNHPPYFRC